MRKTSILGILALVSVAAIAVVWFTLSGPEEAGAAAPGAAVPAPVERVDEVARAAPERPVERAAPRAEERVPERRTTERSGKLAERPAEELKWVEGRLLLPPGAAWDETAEALSVEAPERQRASRALFSMVLDEGSRPARETAVLYRAPFADDTTFRVACAPDAEWAYLEIDARFLYLPEPQAVKLEGEVTYVDLAPLVGASVKGRWEATDATAVEREFTGGQVYLTTLTDSEMPAFFAPEGSQDTPIFKRTWVAADGTFELRGLDPSVSWTLVSHPPRLASAVTDVEDLVPGEETELVVDLVRGARLSGRVIDRKGGPLFGARLIVTSSEEDVDFRRMKLVSRESLSRGDGTFDVHGIAPGEVRLHAELEGYRNSVRKKFELVAGQEETGIELKLRRGEALRGTVVWPDGTPAPEAVVEVGRDATGETEGLDENWRTRYGVSRADAAGRFELVGLKKRKSSMWAWATRRDGSRWVEGVARVDAVKPSEDEEHRLMLVERPLLTGVVSDGDGRPVPEFTLLVRPDDGAGNMMSFYASQGQEVRREVSAPDGTFLLERLDAGEYSLVVEADALASSDPVGFRIPVPPNAAPLEIVLVDFASVSGLVVGPDGAPIGNSEVSAQRAELSTVDAVLAEVRAPTRARTNARGEFALTQLQPGSIELRAEGALWVDSAPIRLELAPGQAVTGLVVPMRVGARLTGEVRDGEDSPIADRRVSVSQRTQSARRPFGGSSRESTRTDSNGWFEFEGLVPGEATVILHPDQSAEDALAGLGYLDDEEDPNVSVFFGEELSVEVELFDDETTHVVLGGAEELGDPVLVQGRVTRRGRPVSGYVGFQELAERMGAVNATAFVEEGGNYSIELAAPGDYQVRVSGEEYEDQVYFHRFRAGEQVTLDFALPGGRIAGRIFDPEGEPANLVPVTLKRVGAGSPATREDRFAMFDPQQTDESGAYEFDDLEPGRYVVSAGSSFMTLFVGNAVGYGRTLSDPIDLAPDEERHGLDLVLGETCELKGVVEDEAGNPVNGATIFVFRESGVPVDDLSSTTSNASGRFNYESLAPGVYTAMAKTTDQVSPHSAPVRLRTDGETDVRLVLGRGTTLVVQLVDEDGVPLASGVSVTDDRGRELNQLTPFGGLFGSFGAREEAPTRHEVGPVSPGRYRVSARADGRDVVSRDVVVRGGEGEFEVELVVDE